MTITMEKFRPCPPACSSDISFPIILIPEGFWKMNSKKQLAILQAISANRVDLQDALSGSIEELENGGDLIVGD